MTSAPSPHDHADDGTTPTHRVGGGNTVTIALVLDVVFVILFAAIGRGSHAEGVFGPFGIGLATTAAPFVVGAVIGWVIARGWRAPLSVPRTGICVWLSAVIVGVLLRIATGQGTATSFVVVTAITLGVFLLGWRGISALLHRRRQRR